MVKDEVPSCTYKCWGQHDIISEPRRLYTEPKRNLIDRTVTRNETFKEKK
jgi:hypothetical protein